MMKKQICVTLLFSLLFSVLSFSAFADYDTGIEPGQPMPDFTVSLTDGTTATLSELLKEKDLVVLNIFASWCGPCEKEFPEMEKVYQANKDKMVIVSVSGDPDDTMEMISDYKASHGLSFPMGLAGDALDFLTIPGFPTTIFVNRDGKAGFVKVGAFVGEKDFADKVGIFLSSDYDGKPLASESAVNIFPYLAAVSLVGTLLLIIGRWGILRKAGKKSWHSLIPFLNTYQEFSTCWKGWIGLLSDLSVCLYFAANALRLPSFVPYFLICLPVLLGIPESLKLAKVFGKGKVFAILSMIPGLKEILRFFLGVGKAKYQAP